MGYKVIDEEVIYKTNIKKSDFITYLIYVTSKEEADKKINELSKKDATHNCYAYIVEDKNNIYSKFSDDNEPQGTAGLVMLDVIKKNNLINILAFTIRYYGGIKLGVGGLSSAYREGVIESLKKTKLKELKESVIIEFEVNFSEYNQIIKFLNQKYILNLNFNEKVKIKYEILSEELSHFSSEINKILQKKLIYKKIGYEKIKV